MCAPPQPMHGGFTKSPIMHQLLSVKPPGQLSSIPCWVYNVCKLEYMIWLCHYWHYKLQMARYETAVSWNKGREAVSLGIVRKQLYTYECISKKVTKCCIITTVHFQESLHLVTSQRTLWDAVRCRDSWNAAILCTRCLGVMVVMFPQWNILFHLTAHGIRACTRSVSLTTYINLIQFNYY